MLQRSILCLQGTQYATKRSILCRGAFCGPTLLVYILGQGPYMPPAKHNLHSVSLIGTCMKWLMGTCMKWPFLISSYTSSHRVIHCPSVNIICLLRDSV